MDKFMIRKKRNIEVLDLDEGAGTSSSTSGSSGDANPMSMPETKKKKTAIAKAKATYEEKRKRGFVNSWNKEFPWLTHDAEKKIMFCSWCRKIPELADDTGPLYKGTGPGAQKPTDYRKGGLTTHDISANHKKVAAKKFVQDNPGKAPMDIHLKNLSKHETDRLKILMNTAHFTAKEDIAMHKFPKLCDLQEKNGVDIGRNYRTDKKCREFVDAIAKTTRDDIKHDIENARFFTVMADGTTDSGVLEQEAVYVRYVNGGEIQTKMVDCINLDAGNAEGVLKGIDKGLKSVGVDEDAQKEKLIACSFDGAAVNMGKDSGVAKRLTDRVGKHLIRVHCVAHNMELAILDVVHNNTNNDVQAGDIKHMEVMEDTMRGVYKFYHMSPKQRRSLKELSDILDEDEPYYSGVKTVRWLASRYRALSAVETHYRVTVEHLEHASTGVTAGTNPSAIAAGLVKKLKNVNFVKFMYFMLDFMEVLSILSQTLQADNLLITDVKHELSAATLKLETLKTSPGNAEKKFTGNFNSETNILKHGNGNITLCKTVTRGRGGHAAAEADAGDGQQEQANFSRLKSSVIDHTIHYIDKRFEAFDNPPLSLFSIFDCREWPTTRENLAVYGNDKIPDLVEHFKQLLTEDEANCMQMEWCALKGRVKERAKDAKTSQDVLNIYGHIIRLAPDNLVNIIILVNIMMTISVSTAIVERGFSALNRIKTPQRATMSQECLQSHLMISLNTADISDFTASEREVECWMDSGKGTRHLHGHKH